MHLGINSLYVVQKFICIRNDFLKNLAARKAARIYVNAYAVFVESLCGSRCKLRLSQTLAAG